MSASLPAAPPAGLSTRWAVQRKHEATYTDSAAKIEVSPLTASFVACWCSGDVSLLCLRTGALLSRIAAGSEEAEDQFSAFAVSPDEQSLATVARRSRMIQLWDIKTGAVLATWKAAHQLPVLDLSFSPSGGELASCAADKSIIVYSVRRAGVVTHKFAPSPANPAKGAHKTRVTRVFWHPSVARAMLLSCAEDGEMRLWSLADSSSVLLANHMSQVTSVAFTRDGSTLISGGRDKVVNVWNVSAGASLGAHLRTVPVYESVEGVVLLHSRPACVPAPEADAKGKKAERELYFTTAGSKGVLRTWALSKLECVHEKALPTAATPSGQAAGIAADEASMSVAQRNASKYIANQVAHLLYLPAKKADATGPALEERVLAVTQEQNLYIYATSSFRRTQLLLGFNDEIIDLKAHPDNTHVLLASNSSQIRVLALDNFEASLLSGHTDTVLALDISPCGQYVVSSSKDCTVRFWRLHLPSKDAPDAEEESECIAIGEGHTESVGCVTFSRNKHTGRLYAVSGARERILKLWECDVLKTHKRGSPPLRITASTSRLAHEKDINCVECAPNDRLVASGSEDKHIRIWDGSAAEPLVARGVLKGHRRGVWSVKFSPVDKVLASASGDKTIKLWSMDDFTCLKTLESHTASVKQVSFISSGMQLLSSGDDATVKLWNIASSECVATFPDAHDGKIWSLAVTRDGQTVVTGGSDSVLCVWGDVSAQDVEEAAANRENFLLQEQQLNNLVRNKQWHKAVRLALQLEQPRKCLGILQELLLQEHTTQKPSQLPDIITELAAEQQDEVLAEGETVSSADALLTRLLLYIRDWNTHAKSSHVAQRVLGSLLRALPPSRLLSNRTLLLQAPTLTLYSERHFSRIDKLLTKSFIMDHMLQQMHAVEPEVEQETESATGEAKQQGAVFNSADVLQQLLASAAQDSEDAVAPASRAGSAAAAAAATATATTDDDEGGFSDDDGSAWATNWKAAEGESSDDEEEEKKEEAEASKVEAKGKGKTAAAAKQKRKEPDSSSADATPAAAPTPAKKARASPALKPAASPAAAPPASHKKQKAAARKA